MSDHDTTHEATCRDLVEQMRDIPYSATAEGIVTYIGPQVARYGLSPADVIARSFLDFVSPADRERLAEAFQKLISTGDESPTEFRFQAASGQTYWFEELTSLQYDDEGKVAGVVGTLRDVSERKETLEALKASEKKLKTISDSALDAVVMIDHAGNVMHWNPAAERIFGYRPEEILGRNAHEMLTPPQHREAARQGFARFAHTGTGYAVGRVMELEAIRKDGSEFPIEIAVSPIPLGGRWWASAVIRDITERKKAEEELAQSLMELQAIHDGNQDGIVVVEAETRRVVRANASMCRMVGYSQAEMLAMTVTDLHPPEALSRVERHFTMIAAGRPVIAENVPVRRKDSSVFYADISASIILYRNKRCGLGFFRDATERRQAAEALRQEDERLRRLLEMYERDHQLVAYEIHDGLTQPLIAALMHLESVMRTAGSDPPQGPGHGCHEVARLLRQSIDEARQMIAGLRPAILDEMGLRAAIEHVIYEQERQGGPRIEYVEEVAFDRLAAPLETAVFRIVQEALNNALRHSKSERVRISLTQQDQRIRVLVEDWGTGFEPAGIEENRYGLEGIRTRAQLFGGVASIESAPDDGTRVVVELPLVEPAPPIPPAGEDAEEAAV